MGIVLIVPPVANKLHEDCGVGKRDGETDGNTLPQFLSGRDDTHSEFLDGFREKRASFLAKTLGGPKTTTLKFKRDEAYLNSAWKTITNAGI